MEHNETEQGPWARYCGYMEIPYQGQWYRQLPAPFSDGIDNPLPTGYHGAASIRKWVKWFPRFARHHLRQHGFVLRVYECPDCYVQRGQWQVIFPPEHAKVINTIPL